VNGRSARGGRTQRETNQTCSHCSSNCSESHREGPGLPEIENARASRRAGFMPSNSRHDAVHRPCGDGRDNQCIEGCRKRLERSQLLVAARTSSEVSLHPGQILRRQLTVQESAQSRPDHSTIVHSVLSFSLLNGRRREIPRCRSSNPSGSECTTDAAFPRSRSRHRNRARRCRRVTRARCRRESTALGEIFKISPISP